MSSKTEGMVIILAALLVLFAAMIDPRVSAGIAVAVLAGLGIFRMTRR